MGDLEPVQGILNPKKEAMVNLFQNALPRKLSDLFRCAWGEQHLTGVIVNAAYMVYEVSLPQYISTQTIHGLKLNNTGAGQCPLVSISL